VVRFPHLLPPAALRANAGIKKTTSNFLNLVERLNLTFERSPQGGLKCQIRSTCVTVGIFPEQSHDNTFSKPTIMPEFQEQVMSQSQAEPA
jgi:hypothetical protein